MCNFFFFFFIFVFQLFLHLFIFISESEQFEFLLYDSLTFFTEMELVKINTGDFVWAFLWCSSQQCEYLTSFRVHILLVPHEVCACVIGCSSHVSSLRHRAKN